MLPVGLVRGGFPRGFPTAALRAAPPFPFVLLSPATGCRASVPAHANRRAVPTLFHNFPLARVILLPLPCRPANDTAHGRRNNACRRARLRRPSAGFSNGGAARSAAVPFCPSLPRRPAVLLSLPSRPDNDAARAHSRSRKPAGSPFPFPHFPARPSRASSFTLPPGQRYRARSPKQCLPKGSSEAAFSRGFFQCRRGGASRGARPRRLSTGFSNGGAARSAAVPFCPSLPRRLGNGCRAPVPAHANRRAVPTLFHIFPARPSHASSFTLPPGQRYRARSPKQCLPKGSSEAAFCGVLQGRRGDARRRARLRRPSTGFSNGGAARSAAVPFCPSLPRHRMPRVRSRPCEPAGSPFPFPHFPTARSYFFLYPAVLPAMPLATFPASFCPAGRQGQRRFLCRLHGRRSSALPFRPIGGAPGTAPLFLHPAARGTDAARPFPPMRTGGQSLPFSTFSRRPAVLLSLPSRPASDTAHGRRNNACRRARLRRPSTGFCNGGAARSAAVPFCPSFPRRLAVLLSLPSARTTMPHEHIPVHANRRAVPTLFHIFPARPSRASSFTLPPGQRYRARSPR